MTIHYKTHYIVQEGQKRFIPYWYGYRKMEPCATIQEAKNQLDNFIKNL